METNVKDDVEETRMAVSSILSDHVYSTTADISHKRKRDDSDHSNTTPKSQNSDSPNRKKSHNLNLYQESNNGPFEVVVQDLNKRKINPFNVGKIIKNHFNEINHISRAGKNLVVTCTSYSAANKLVESHLLSAYKVFIPSIRIHSLGVVYVEPEVSEEEILEETDSICPIIQVSRIKKYIDKTLTDTHFVKITFDSDKLPEAIYLNYVRMPVERYVYPVKQCFRCFDYGHVMQSPCNNIRICRDCGDNFHSGECKASKKCKHCAAPHSSNSRQCPEYQRQRNIKERMSASREDFFTASRYFPITYKKTNYKAFQSYASAARQHEEDGNDYPSLPNKHPNTLPQEGKHFNAKNRYAVLSNLPAPEEDEYSGHYMKNPHHIQGRMYRKQNNSYPSSNTHTITSTAKNSGRQPERQYPPQIQTQQEATPGNTGSKPFNVAENDRLKSLLKEKITEIRNKIHSTSFTTKKQIEDFLTTYIGEETPPKSSVDTSPGKSNTNSVNNTGTNTPNPDKNDTGNNNKKH